MYIRSCILTQEKGSSIYVAQFRYAVYILHAFRKKTRKTSKGDIEKAKSRLQAELQMEVGTG